MSKKLTATLLGLLIVLAVISLILDKSGSPPASDLQGDALLDTAFLDEIQILKLKNKDGEVELQISDHQFWTVQSEPKFPADADKILDLLDRLTNAEIRRVVSRNKGQWESLEISEDHYVFTGTFSGELKTVYLGKKRSGGGQYAAWEDNPAAFLIDQTITFDTAPKAWETKTLLSFDRDDIQAVSLPTADEQKSFTLERPSADADLTLANLPADKVTASTEVAKLMSFLANLSFTDRLPKTAERAKQALASAKQATVTTFDDATYRLTLGSLEEKSDQKDKETELNYYLSVEFVGDENHPSAHLYNKLFAPWIFQIDNHQAKNLLKQREQFMTDKPPEDSENQKTGTEDPSKS
jgi:hypothetical protein